jgi:hypothetical protein
MIQKIYYLVAILSASTAGLITVGIAKGFLWFGYGLGDIAVFGLFSVLTIGTLIVYLVVRKREHYLGGSIVSFILWVITLVFLFTIRGAEAKDLIHF